VRILHVATELLPVLKVGGLADVLAALPREQGRRGQDARVLLPGLPAVLDGLEQVRPLPGWSGAGSLLRGRAGGLDVYALDQPEHFAGLDSPYVDSGGDPRRFAAFAAAAARLARHGDGEGWTPDIAHLHDWPAALAAAYLAREAAPRPPTVLTVHNAGYQGLFPAASFPALGLPDADFSPEGLEFHGQVSLLKAGLLHAGRLATVSPTYAADLQTPERGFGLDGLFRQRAEAFSGILNGVDGEVWNPATDAALAWPFDRGSLEGRAWNKAALQSVHGLRVDPDTPLLAVVSRLDAMKGLDLLLANAERLAAADAQLLVLGRGDGALADAFDALAARRPGRVAWVRGHNEVLARRIFGGADFLVMPSRSEPCGLTQLYALRYGTVPVVRRTGGLADTVRDGNGSATGIVFEEATAGALGAALDRACALYRRDPGGLRALQDRGMAQDFGWAAPAGAYEALYASLLPA
jgi:starch synthase